MSEQVTARQLQAAKDAVNVAMTEANRLDELYEQQTVIPAMRRNIGRCFKYRNSSGSSEAWWMYLRIAGVNEESAHYRCLTIQKRDEGTVDVEFSWWAYHHRDESSAPLGSGYIEISRNEFASAVQPIIGEVNRMAFESLSK